PTGSSWGGLSCWSTAGLLQLGERRTRRTEPLGELLQRIQQSPEIHLPVVLGNRDWVVANHADPSLFSAAGRPAEQPELLELPSAVVEDDPRRAATGPRPVREPSRHSLPCLSLYDHRATRLCG